MTAKNIYIHIYMYIHIYKYMSTRPPLLNKSGLTLIYVAAFLFVILIHQQRAVLHLCVYTTFLHFPSAAARDINHFSHPCEFPGSSPRGEESSKENKPEGAITGMWVCYSHRNLSSLQQVLHRMDLFSICLIWYLSSFLWSQVILTSCCHLEVAFSYSGVVNYFTQ